MKVGKGKHKIKDNNIKHKNIGFAARTPIPFKTVTFAMIGFAPAKIGCAQYGHMNGQSIVSKVAGWKLARGWYAFNASIAATKSILPWPCSKMEAFAFFLGLSGQTFQLGHAGLLLSCCSFTRTAVSINACFKLAGFRWARRSSGRTVDASSTDAPVTTGAATLVPESALQPLLIPDLRYVALGGVTSSELRARASACTVDATYNAEPHGDVCVIGGMLGPVCIGFQSNRILRTQAPAPRTQQHLA